MRRVIRAKDAPAPEWAGEQQTKRKRMNKCYALAEELGLTDDSRHELALMIPSIDKDSEGSWRSLNSQQLHELLTMLEGYVFVRFLLDNQS